MNGRSLENLKDVETWKNVPLETYQHQSYGIVLIFPSMGKSRALHNPLLLSLVPQLPAEQRLNTPESCISSCIAQAVQVYACNAGGSLLNFFIISKGMFICAFLWVCQWLLPGRTLLKKIHLTCSAFSGESVQSRHLKNATPEKIGL